MHCIAKGALQKLHLKMSLHCKTFFLNYSLLKHKLMKHCFACETMFLLTLLERHNFSHKKLGVVFKMYVLLHNYTF